MTTYRSHRIGDLYFIPTYQGALRLVIEGEPDPEDPPCHGTNDGWDAEGLRWSQPCLLPVSWWVVGQSGPESFFVCPDHAFDLAVDECKKQFFGGTGVNEAEGEAASEGSRAGSGSDTRAYPGASTTTEQPDRKEQGDA